MNIQMEVLPIQYQKYTGGRSVAMLRVSPTWAGVWGQADDKDLGISEVPSIPNLAAHQRSTGRHAGAPE